MEVQTRKQILWAGSAGGVVAAGAGVIYADQKHIAGWLIVMVGVLTFLVMALGIVFRRRLVGQPIAKRGNPKAWLWPAAMGGSVIAATVTLSPTGNYVLAMMGAAWLFAICTGA